MTVTKSAALVLQAEGANPTRLTKSLASFDSMPRNVAEEAMAAGLLRSYRPWFQALNEANLHITVRPEEIEAAKDAYEDVARLLLAKLDWPRSDINIAPQGSASTKTLIRSPFGGEKFDIDAVCEVRIDRVATNDPMGFFGAVGSALKELEAEAKKRCWHIPFLNRPFYLEFTPSVPLESVPQPLFESMSPLYRTVPQYKTSALAVVDTPTRGWKTSNPEGMAQWVDSTAKRPLIRQVVMESMALLKAEAGVDSVPDQEVEISDTLRIAIRLFKRHRDMCVKRNIIPAEFKPISIIIVTLLTSCYEGLADLGRTFDHPVELLDEIVSLLPHLILNSEDNFWVNNPTVEGENFAEKWNLDDGARHQAFVTWCSALRADLRTILALDDPQQISKRVREVFGIPAPTSNGTNDGAPSRFRAPTPTPRGNGLA